jgi:hypothetical protein
VADAYQHTARPKSEPGVALRHVAPDGRHLLRAIRPGELLFRPERDDGLAEYRCLMQMEDGAIVNSRLHLRPAAVAAQPSGIPLARRLWLAASVPQRHERTCTYGTAITITPHPTVGSAPPRESARPQDRTTRSCKPPPLRTGNRRLQPAAAFGALSCLNSSNANTDP